jgi:energy-converting hydrogenase A subunit R
MTASKNDIFLFLDNEGPCTLNDNAQESTVALAKASGLGEEVGVNFYRGASNIDDIWGDFHRISKDPSYSSGHTLKVVLPFFRAMGATTEWLERFARENLRVVPKIGTVLSDLNHRFSVWQISTSYEFFVRAFCNTIEFDFARARCTAVDGFDRVPVAEAEKRQLLAFMQEAATMPIIQYDGETGEVAPEHQAHYDRFTQFVWEVVYGMPVGQFLQTVRPVGQAQKREAVEHICCEFGVPKERAMYVGDSQTDVQCVELLQRCGLTMMFNGKGRVCRISDIMYIGEDASAIAEVAHRFAELGRDGVLRYYSPAREAECGGLIATVTPENVDELHERSVKKRKEFRGIHIGTLT